MNVVNLRSALDTANAMGLDDLDKFWLPQQTCSLWRTAPATFPGRGVSTHPFGAQMVLHAVNVAHGCPRTHADAKLPRARSKKRRGDCVLMDSRLLHRSTANVSDRQ